MPFPLTEPEWLLAHLTDPNLRIVDTRFTLGKPSAGRAAYEAGHIPGSIFLDLENNLSAPVRPDRVGGRHPIPTPDDFAAMLSSFGIGNSHHIIAYDDPSSGSGFYAAHLWWLLRYFGHDQIAVLNGGLPAWTTAGGDLERVETNYEEEKFEAHPRSEMIVNADEVADRKSSTILIDSRAPERYRGDIEPIDPKAGHIPGAINRNWADGLQDGRWRVQSQQQARFPELQSGAETIVYCGSGVSAGGNLLALELAGYRSPKLYAGSWSDWTSDPTRPIETGA